MRNGFTLDGVVAANNPDIDRGEGQRFCTAILLIDDTADTDIDHAVVLVRRNDAVNLCANDVIIFPPERQDSPQ